MSEHSALQDELDSYEEQLGRITAILGDDELTDYEKLESIAEVVHGDGAWGEDEI